MQSEAQAELALLGRQLEDARTHAQSTHATVAAALGAAFATVDAHHARALEAQRSAVMTQATVDGQTVELDVLRGNIDDLTDEEAATQYVSAASLCPVSGV